MSQVVLFKVVCRSGKAPVLVSIEAHETPKTFQLKGCAATRYYSKTCKIDGEPADGWARTGPEAIEKFRASVSNEIAGLEHQIAVLLSRIEATEGTMTAVPAEDL